MKTIKFTLAVIITCFAFTTMADAQVKKKSPYPNFSVSPVGGVAFPIGDFGGSYKAGPSFGLDISYRVNREVAFYLKGGYNIFAFKEVAGVVSFSDAKILEITVGPRYYFTSRNLKSAFFLEAGAGLYSLKQQLTAATPVVEVSTSKFGINAGIGAVLNLSTPLDLIFKVKYHNILTEGGSTSYVAPLLGIDFRFN